MATFEAQVEALTGIAISGSSNPTQTELTQFLKDGVIDVTDKWLLGHPQDMEDFQRKSAIIDSNGGLDLNSARIISVVRENEADGSSDGSTAWRPCRKISPAQQSQVVDTESLSFASKYHPVYMIDENGKINVYPTPDGTNDGYRIYYVNNVPTDLTNEVALTYAHSDLKYFPADKVHLVALYASVKSINNNMAAIITDLSSFSITPVPPNFADGYEDPATDVPASGFSGENIEAEIAKMQDYIEVSEDVELANAKSSEIGLRFKRAIDQFQSGLGKYSAEIQGYAQEVVAEVSEQGQKVQTETAKYQWLQDRAAALQAEYVAAFATPQPQ